MENLKSLVIIRYNYESGLLGYGCGGGGVVQDY